MLDQYFTRNSGMFSKCIWPATRGEFAEKTLLCCRNAVRTEMLQVESLELSITYGECVAYAVTWISFKCALSKDVVTATVAIPNELAGVVDEHSQLSDFVNVLGRFDVVEQSGVVWVRGDGDDSMIAEFGFKAFAVAELTNWDVAVAVCGPVEVITGDGCWFGLAFDGE